MLSSQALNIGRSLGVNSNMEKFTFDSDVRRCHVCNDVWKPAIGKILHAQQELDSAVDKFAVKVVKNNKTFGHLLCEYSRILWYLNAPGRKNPCRLVFSCSTYVKIDRLKELLESKTH